MYSFLDCVSIKYTRLLNGLSRELPNKSPGRARTKPPKLLPSYKLSSKVTRPISAYLESTAHRACLPFPQKLSPSSYKPNRTKKSAEPEAP